MIWLIYNVVFMVLCLLAVPAVLAHMIRRGGYRAGFRERFAVIGADVLARLQERRRVWVHAVSVGEVLVALRLMRELRTLVPDIAFVLTVTTSTGRKIAAKGLDVRDVLLSFPVDFPWVMNRELDLVKPSALVLIEGEWWPNLIRLAAGRGVPVYIVNGRMSARSLSRYKAVGVFFRRIAACIRMALVQTEEDAARFRALGIDGQNVKIMGTVKYDVAERDEAAEKTAAEALASAGFGTGTKILLGGSTWPGEEQVLLGIFSRFKNECEGLRLVLVPRHVERCREIISGIEAAGLKYVLRKDCGAGKSPRPDAEVMLVNTTGELRGFYAAAEVVFVGRSLTSHGGQNVIEPALCSKPVVVGPHMENFPSVMEDFLSAKAIVQSPDAESLERSIRGLLADTGYAQSLGQLAAGVVATKRGTIRSAAQALACLPGCGGRIPARREK